MVSEAFALVCKKRDVTFYATAEVEDLDYILHDFAPDYLICDGKTLQDYKERALELLLKNPHECNLILLGDNVASQFSPLQWQQHWTKPIDPLQTVMNLMEA
jgi:long-subunit acyl-CoA synthetase (AMP-forming)